MASQWPITHRFYPLRDSPQWGVVASRLDKPRAAKFIPHTGIAKAKVADLVIGAPAPDGSTWPCGHPRTEANTQSIGEAGVRCRICRRKIGRESYRRRKAK